MRLSRIGWFGAAFALVALHANTASAAGGSAALLVGEGFKDGYNFGLGARAGFTLPMNVYVGGTFVYHLGRTEPAPGGEFKANVLYFGAEGGYELGAGPLTVRPYMGLGYASASASRPPDCTGLVCGAVQSNSEGVGAIWPGVTAIFPLGNFFVGGDVRYVILLGSDKVDNGNAFSIFVTGGTTF